MNFKEFRLRKEGLYLTESKTLEIIKNLVNKIPFLKNIVNLSDIKKTIQNLSNKIGNLTEEEYKQSLELANKILRNPNNINLQKESYCLDENLFNTFRDKQKIVFGAILAIMLAGQLAQPLAGTFKELIKQKKQIEHNIQPVPDDVRTDFSDQNDVQNYIKSGGEIGDTIKIGGDTYHVGKGEGIKSMQLGMEVADNRAKTKSTSGKISFRAVGPNGSIFSFSK